MIGWAVLLPGREDHHADDQHRPLDDGDRAVYLGPWLAQRLADGRVMAARLLGVGDELRLDPSLVRCWFSSSEKGVG